MEPKKKKWYRNPYIIVLALLVLAILAFALWMLIFPDPAPRPIVEDPNMELLLMSIRFELDFDQPVHHSSSTIVTRDFDRNAVLELLSRYEKVRVQDDGGFRGPILEIWYIPYLGNSGSMSVLFDSQGGHWYMSRRPSFFGFGSRFIRYQILDADELLAELFEVLGLTDVVETEFSERTPPPGWERVQTIYPPGSVSPSNLVVTPTAARA